MAVQRYYLFIVCYFVKIINPQLNLKSFRGSEGLILCGCFFLLLTDGKATADRVMGAGFLAFPAPDAFGTVGLLIDGDIHLAGVLTYIAPGTFGRVHLVMIEGPWITQAVYGAQRADILAERPVADDR